MKIKHVWFDFSQTMVFENKEIHDELKYKTYAEAVGRPVSDELRQEYEALYREKKSNSGVFASLGLGAGYWSERYSNFDPSKLLTLAEPGIPQILVSLMTIVPISLWSNVHAERILPALGIRPEWFAHILSPDEVKRPKPALDGFNLLIERSGVPAENILFVGDSVEKEMIPAKSLGIQTALMWKQATEADRCFSSFKQVYDFVAENS